MTKDEFMNDLRRALAVDLSSAEIEVHVKYYMDYIAMEQSKGKTENEILENLGNPRLIAKSILEAKGDGEKQANAEKKAEKMESKLRKIPSWLSIILLVVILIVFVGILLRIFVQLLPFLLIVVAIIMVVSFFRRIR